MKRIMISHGLTGKDDPDEYVKKCRATVKEHYEALGEEIEIIDTYFTEDLGSRLQYLARSISHGLDLADEVVFMDNWQSYDGCTVENFICAKYGIKTIYLKNLEFATWGMF